MIYLLNKYSNVVIALFTIILAITSIRQWWTSEETLKIGNRAWVNTYPLEAPFALNQPLAYAFRLNNEGRTPAQQFEAKFRVQSYSIKSSPDFSFPKENTDDFKFAILSPGANLPIYFTTMKKKTDSGASVAYLVDQNFLDQYNKGQIWVAMFAEVTYVDVFKDKHTQHYCRAYINRTVNPDVEFSGEQSCIDYNSLD